MHSGLVNVQSELPLRAFESRVVGLLSPKEYIPRPTPNVRAVRVVNLRAITEPVPVLINTAGLSVIKANCVHTELRQKVQFAWF